MNIDRRKMLQLAGATPIAAAMPLAAIPATAAAAPFPLPEPNVWRWWAGWGETYHIECYSRADALKAAAESGYPYICEAIQGDFDLSVDGGTILEDLIDRNGNDERCGEGEFIKCSPTQERDLSEMLTRTMYEWAAKHGISLTSWAFVGCRNEERVECEAGE